MSSLKSETRISITGRPLLLVVELSHQAVMAVVGVPVFTAQVLDCSGGSREDLDTRE